MTDQHTDWVRFANWYLGKLTPEEVLAYAADFVAETGFPFPDPLVPRCTSLAPGREDLHDLERRCSLPQHDSSRTHLRDGVEW